MSHPTGTHSLSRNFPPPPLLLTSTTHPTCFEGKRNTYADEKQKEQTRNERTTFTEHKHSQTTVRPRQHFFFSLRRMQPLWAFVYGWVTGIAIVIVLILYGFDFLLRVMRFVARLLGALNPVGGQSYTALYENSFFHGTNPDGTAKHLYAESAENFSDSDADEEEDGAQLPSTRTTQKRKKSHKRRLYGKVNYDDRRSLRDQGLEGMTGHTSTIQPMKLSTMCTLSWFNEADNSFGAPLNCRLLLTGRTITVYELLSSGSTGASSGGGSGAGNSASGANRNPSSRADGLRDATEADVARAEHMKGKIHTGFISSKELKKFNKENKEAAAATPFTGRVLVMSTTDGNALFAVRDADPANAAPSPDGPTQQTSVPSPFTDARPEGGNITPTARPRKSTARGGGPMGSWNCIIIKFNTARESERWQNLLSGIAEADAWRQFAKSMPNPDTLNTFLSRFFFQNMRDGNGIDDAIKNLIRKQLVKVSAKKFPRDLQGELKLDDFIIGTSIPWVSDVSDPAVSTNGEVGFDFNIMYKGLDGGLELFFRLALQYRGIRVPHAWFSVKLLELEGTAHMSIGPPPSKKFWIGGHKPPVMRLEVHQGCASGSGILHRILTSLPDLSGIFTNLIKLYLFSDMILPVMDDFPLPNLAKTPKSSPREAKQRTFDRRRAAQHSAAPTLAGAFTREQLQEVERLLEMNEADKPDSHDVGDDADADNQDEDADADAYWHPLVDQQQQQSTTSAGTRRGGGADADVGDASSSGAAATAFGLSGGAAGGSSLMSPANTTTNTNNNNGSSSAGRSGTKKVSFPTASTPRGQSTATTASATGSRGPAKKSLVTPRETSGTASASTATARPAQASSHTSRDVLMASAVSGSGVLSPDASIMSPTAPRLDASVRTNGGADGDDATPLSPNQRPARPTRSVRSLLKFKGDEMSKASVVRRKAKKGKEEEL